MIVVFRSESKNTMEYSNGGYSAPEFVGTFENIHTLLSMLRQRYRIVRESESEKKRIGVGDTEDQMMEGYWLYVWEDIS